VAVVDARSGLAGCTAVLCASAQRILAAADPTALEEGMKVEHQKFGFGIIKTIEGSAHNPIANILFDVNGEKKIMLNYAKLMIINS
jgi:hypothetical protein